MTATLNQLFGTGPQSEEGVWVDFADNAQGDKVKFLIAEGGSERHEKCQRRYSRALERTRRNKKAHDEVLRKIVAESLLLDWQGVLDENGQQVPCTIENKLAALKKYRKLYVFVLDNALDEENFRPPSDVQAAEEDTEKN